MDTLLQDLRYAARKLLRTPGFTAVAVVTLALAIGATTAVYSIVDGVLLKPLPFRAPSELVRVTSTSKRDGSVFPISASDYLDYRDQSTSFAAMANYQRGTANLSTNGGDPMHVDRLFVGARFFDVLGVAAVRGRLFATNEDEPGQNPVAVLSEKLWRTRFGADPRVIGQTITVDEKQYRIIGVAPRSVDYPQAVDVYLPRGFQHTADPNARGNHSLFAIARLKPGVSAARASQDLAAIALRLGQQYPEMDVEFSASVQPLQEQMVGNLAPTLYALLGAVAFVLLIACANVANLLLVRGASRSSEMAVRTALGAGRGRIVRQLVTESVLLAAMGAVIGTALAAWVVDAVVAFGPRALPRLQDVSIDGRVLAFSAGIAVLTGLVFGLVPALHAARPDIAGMLRASVRGSTRGGANRTRSVLVMAEMALAVVLLVGAGLLVKSFVALIHVNPGFSTDHVVSFDLTLPGSKYKSDASTIAFATELQGRLRALPGTQQVGFTMGRPLSHSLSMTPFDVDGRPVNDPQHRTITEVHSTSPEYFDAMGETLAAGRYFTDAENRRDGHHVLLVNEELARRYFKGESPIGKTLILGFSYSDSPATGPDTAVNGEVVGVVHDVKQRGLSSDAFPAVFVPFNALPGNLISFAVHSNADPAAIEREVRKQVRALDPNLPVFGLGTMADVVSESVAQPRFYMVLLSAFAGIALLLAALGIYGVISYTVAQRSRELGIRIALGASRERVVGHVLGQGLTMTLVGVGLGLVAAFGLTRLIATMLFGVAALDPITFAGVAVGLTAIAVLASWLPARRAAAVDPVIAMRVE
ncbi:MAG TPA: ABC transporter permease [Gemmatimonadaceae bacterium]|nr:ABC transporter permease [Gemmatimonadaceae bacterium]